MTKILSIGSPLTDILIKIDDEKLLSTLHLTKGGMHLVTDENYRKTLDFIAPLASEMATGGSAANTALCISMLHGPAALFGKVNFRDVAGQNFMKQCKERHIVTHFVDGERPSGVAITFVTPDGERTFATYLGAASEVKAEELTPDVFTHADIVHIEGYLVANRPFLLRAYELAHAAGAKVSLDMASFNLVEAERDFFDKILPITDIVFANEEEAKAWSGKTPRESLDQLAILCDTAVVKVGAKGAWAKSGEIVEFCPANKVENVVDTTAAGDFFAGGFLNALHQGGTLADALKCGTYCASEVIQVMGTQVAKLHY